MSSFFQVLSYLPAEKIPTEGFDEAWYYKISHDFSKSLPPYDEYLDHSKLYKINREKYKSYQYAYWFRLNKLFSTNRAYYDFFISEVPHKEYDNIYSVDPYGVWILLDILYSGNEFNIESFVKLCSKDTSLIDGTVDLFWHVIDRFTYLREDIDKSTRILSRYEKILEKIPFAFENFFEDNLTSEDLEYCRKTIEGLKSSTKDYKLERFSQLLNDLFKKVSEKLGIPNAT